MRIFTNRLKEKYESDSVSLANKTIHDDAASNSVRFKSDVFTTIKKINGTLNGVTGSTNEIRMGSIKDGDDIWKKVLYVPELGYNLDSERQLVDELGWKKETSLDPYVKAYYKYQDGKRITRRYQRSKGQSHFLMVNVLSVEDNIRKAHSMY